MCRKTLCFQTEILWFKRSGSEEIRRRISLFLQSHSPRQHVRSIWRCNISNQINAAGFAAILSGNTSAAMYMNTVNNITVSASSNITLTSARWINALLFVSLVLSLAAALFGIMVKQWLREYMQWNSPLAIPRENVLVRQIRVEAWETWKVSIIIASIPVILELAMVLFLIGIVVLLWTVDNAVAMVVTSAVTIFLFTFAAFTVLPIFFKQCSYKSPSAWACMVAYHYASSSIIWIFHALSAYIAVLLYRQQQLIQNLNGNIFLLHLKALFYSVFWKMSSISAELNWNSDCKLPDIAWATRSHTWRDQDLNSIVVTKLYPCGRLRKSVNIQTAARHDLATAMLNFDKNGQYIQIQNVDYWQDVKISTVLKNIGETSYLVRALSWIECASQEARVLAYLSQCTTSIYSEIPSEVWTGKISIIYAVTFWTIISALYKKPNGIFNAYASLLNISDNEMLGNYTITTCRRATGIYIQAGKFYQHETKTPLDDKVSLNSPYTSILLQMLNSYINMEATVQDEKVQRLYFFRSFELYIFLEYLYYTTSLKTPTLEHAFSSVCRNIWLQSRDQVSKYCPGMLSASFWHIATISKITWNQEKQELGMN